MRVDLRDVCIHRETGYQTKVMDCDGELIFMCQSYLDDDEIMRMVGLYNNAYRAGWEGGSNERAAQIRAALGVTP
jgi:hypothetical protein